MCGLNIAYMLEQGGMQAMQAKAQERSEMLYKFIDESGGYYSNGV